MTRSTLPTPAESIPYNTRALQIGRGIDLRAEARRAATLLPKALMNFDEADPLPLAGCFIRELNSNEAHWCEICGDQRTQAREALALPEHEIGLCVGCAETIEGT